MIVLLSYISRCYFYLCYLKVIWFLYKKSINYIIYKRILKEDVIKYLKFIREIIFDNLKNIFLYLFKIK